MDFESPLKPLEAASSRLSPTMIAQASRCLHFYSLEKFGDRAEKLPESAGGKLIKERGKEFERKVVASLRDVREPEWNHKNFNEGYASTLKLLEQGFPWIHSGVLTGEGLVGIPDLLQKMPGRSNFGDYFYIPIEIKNHAAVQKRDILQVVAYGILLEQAQGRHCGKGGVWLNTGKVDEVDLSKHAASLQKIIGQIRQIESQELKTEPIWCSACTTCPWLRHCKEAWRKTDHLSLLPNGGQSTVKKLYPLGIKTVSALADSDPQIIVKKTKMSANAAQKLWLHARAMASGKPMIIKKPHFPDGRPVIFWDIETHESTLFLHGLISLFNGKREEKFFYADSADQEAKIWHEFLDYIAQCQDGIIFNWADYERSWAVSSWKKHGGNEHAYKQLMANMVDQCRWTQEHFAFPTRSYSIKEVAPVFDFHWQAGDAGGANCEAWYGDWLGSRDKAIKNKILIYNRDDVLAMEIIYQKLKTLCEST